MPKNFLLGSYEVLVTGIIVFKAATMGVVTERCIKYPGGRTLIRATDVTIIDFPQGAFN